MRGHSRIMIHVRRIQNKEAYRCWVYYPKARGCTVQGWKRCEGGTLEEVIDGALSRLRGRLINRVKARTMAVSAPAEGKES